MRDGAAHGRAGRMTSTDIKHDLREKVQRQKAFFASQGPGGLLAYVHTAPAAKEDNSGTPYARMFADKNSDDLKNKEGLAGFVYRAVINGRGEVIPNETSIDAAVGAFVRQHREKLAESESPPPGDAIPCVYPHWDIGWHTAAMVGLPPSYSKGSWWLEPNLDWEAIDQLHFDPSNPWLVTAKHTHKALWKYWDEDYWTMPFIHRSPLDYANGLRGTVLFMEMLTIPDRVKGLLDWCVDWQLKVEAFIYDGIIFPEEWGTGIMGTWGPERAVWVNGDPVGLISRQMMGEFEQPYTGRLFTSTGRGFFHNHTLGLYQADRVAATPGIHMQNFARDLNRPTVEQTLLEDPAARDRILSASLQTPIHISSMTPETVRSVLPILKDGRFMLDIACEKNDDREVVAREIRQVSRIQ